MRMAQLFACLFKAGLLKSVEDNLVDKVWGSSRPPLPRSALLILEQEYSG